MDQAQQRKWVNLSYIFSGALLTYLVHQLSIFLIARFDLEAQISNLDLWLPVFSVLWGVGLFVYLYQHKATNVFMEEAVTELSHVTWPQPDDTWKATMVVIVMVFLAGMMLGVFDAIWTRILKMVV